jgi:AAHS family 4-hydroxybenzoate transporter-like MFS transporter
MVVFSVGMYGLMAILSSFANDVMQLIVLRFFTGVAVASAIPSIVALVGEFAPMRRRSSFITFSYFGLSLGQISAGLTSDLLLIDFGWRAVLLAGGVIALAIVPVLLFLLPESIEYLVNRGGKPERALQTLQRAVPDAALGDNTVILAGERATQRVFVTELFQERRSLGTILIWLAIMMNLIPNQFFGNWLTTILVDSGFSESEAIYVKMANDGAGMIVAFIIGPLMDRYGPYRVMVATFLLGSVFVAATGVTLTYGAFIPIITMAVLVGLCNSGIQKGSNAVGAHFYPTALRSAGIGWGLGVGRLSAFATPIIAGILLDLGWPPASLFYLVAAPLIVGALAHFTLQKFYGARRAAETQSPAEPLGE